MLSTTAPPHPPSPLKKSVLYFQIVCPWVIFEKKLRVAFASANAYGRHYPPYQCDHISPPFVLFLDCLLSFQVVS